MTTRCFESENNRSDVGHTSVSVVTNVWLAVGFLLVGRWQANGSTMTNVRGSTSDHRAVALIADDGQKVACHLGMGYQREGCS